MDEPRSTSTLWDYRRRVADLYGRVRTEPDPAAAWRLWRRGRDQLFASHAQSPLSAHVRAGFRGLSYFDYDPRWRLSGVIVGAEPRTLAVAHSGEGVTSMRRYGSVRFTASGRSHEIGLYWLETYGGGVFLPFRDATSGGATYGGGRYLLDTAKGADLGHDAGAATIVLDFNFAYHPSCVHDPRWSCPLAPDDNRLPIAIEAGERLP